MPAQGYKYFVALLNLAFTIVMVLQAAPEPALAFIGQAMFGSLSASPGNSDAPAKIANLKLWLKADAITGTADGNSVASWSDASGNNFNVSQATPANQPTFRTGQIAGLPVLSFNGTSHFLQGSFTGSITDKTMFAVVRLATLTPSGSAASGGPFSVQSADGAVFDHINYNEIQVRRWSNGSDNGSRSPQTVAPTDEVSTGPLLIAIRSTASSYILYRNGVELKATTAYSPPTMTNGKFNVSLRHNGGGSPYFYGDIAEIVLYDRAITAAERQTIETYFRNKFNLW